MKVCDLLEVAKLKYINPKTIPEMYFYNRELDYQVLFDFKKAQYFLITNMEEIFGVSPIKAQYYAVMVDGDMTGIEYNKGWTGYELSMTIYKSEEDGLIYSESGDL